MYIFECKNWKEAVGKNEIIVFAEKIAAASAQRGFFIAKSFTADALAQASKEPRMELVVASEHDPANTTVPFGYHMVRTTPTHVTPDFKKWGPSLAEPIEIDLPKAVVTLNGNPIDMLEYINNWGAEAINESMRTFASGTLADGAYQRECTSQRLFEEGVLLINGTSMRTATIAVQFDILLVHPAIKSDFEINGRGRVISCAGRSINGRLIEKAV